MNLFFFFVFSFLVTNLNEKQKAISRLGKCPCSSLACKDGESGLVIGFVILKQYDDSNAPKSTDVNSSVLQELADHVRQQWNFGTCDNNILIAFATDTKQYGISFGENANKVLNETWSNAIVEENFRDRPFYNLNSKLNDLLSYYERAVQEVLKNENDKADNLVWSLNESNNNRTLHSILILCIIIVITVILSLIAFVILRHRKENDDVSLRDVWTKKFWLKAGNQYKEAKQSESAEKDLEKNEDEEVKAKLASTEDLKQDDIENENLDDIQKPKYSKV